MTVAALVLLVLVAGAGLALSARGERRRATWGAVALGVLLAAAGVLAWTPGPASDGVREGVVLAAALAAVTGGGPVATAVLRGLGRYNELRTTPAASERFILGTLASALWATACVGVAVLAAT